MGQGFLADIRVLELADEKAEFCGKRLAGAGADVVKVEPPEGSSTRRIGPFYEDVEDPERSLYFWHYNFGKRGIVLDITTAEGQERPRGLVSESDVLLESHPPGYLDSLGLGYEALKETIRSLRNGGLVAILLDRDVSGTGIPMQFCGAEASIPLGAIELALRTGADLIPAKSWRMPGYSYKIVVEPPLEIVRTDDYDADVRAIAERLLPIFEEQLRSDPGQWAVLDDIWREQPRQGSAVQ